LGLAEIGGSRLAFPCLLPTPLSIKSPMLLAQSFDDFHSSLFIIFDVADEIADDFDLTGIVIRNLHASEFVFDQYHQLETIEPADAEIVTEVRFIGNAFDINTQILANESAHFVGIIILLWRRWLSWAQATEGHKRSPDSFEHLSTQSSNPHHNLMLPKNTESVAITARSRVASH
jgi:hypothetical protein